MEKIKELYSEYKEYILCLLLLIVFLLGNAGIFYYFSNDINKLKKEIKNKPVPEVKEESKNNDKYSVDIKGEVRKPGVYTMNKDKRVIDVVKTAGGLTLEADTSANNLSMKLSDEMVIIIYSKNEIKNYLKTKEKEEKVLEKCKNDIVTNNSCIESSNNSDKKETNTKIANKENNNTKSKTSKNEINEKDENKLVSINTATKEELLTLTGIGESKADAIIEYRKTKKFETIEEIKEVSGIGESLFEKIKDHITT